MLASEQTARLWNGRGGLGGPFAEGLRKQRERRDEEKNVPGRRKALGDAKGGEGLAGAASHDEFARGRLLASPSKTSFSASFWWSLSVFRLRRPRSCGRLRLNLDQSIGLASRS